MSPQHSHHDKLCQSLLEYPEISVHIHELSVSVPLFRLDLGVSGRDPLECQNSGVLMKQGQI